MAKKLTAKSWIIIGVTFVVMGSIAGYSVYSLKKAETEAQIVESHNYATQATVTTESSTYNNTTTSEETEPSYSFNMDPAVSSWLEAPEPDYSFEDEPRYHDVDEAAGFDYSVDLIFNGKEDANSENYLIDIDTISIDGHLIDLPATYNDIARYYTFVEAETYTPETEINGAVILTAKATTGVGEIKFTFSSEGTAKPLSQCICKELLVSSYNYYYEPDGKPMQYNMTMSLVGNIKFGETYEDIQRKMPYTVDRSTADGKKWSLYFEKDGIEYSFTGANDGLVSVYIYINNNG